MGESSGILALLIILAILFLYTGIILWRVPWRVKDNVDWYPPTDGRRKRPYQRRR